MRTALVLLVMFIGFIISLPVVIIAYLLGIFSLKLKARLAQLYLAVVCRMILAAVGVKLSVIGVERVPKNRAVIYVSNHRSHADPVIAYATLSNLTSFIAKTELKNVPILSFWIIFLNGLFIDRDNLRDGLKVIKSGVQLIKQGYSVFVFPEGGINEGDELDLLSFKEGTFKLVKKTGCPIVPVSINNSRYILEEQLPYLKGGNVIIEYGEPIYIENLDDTDQKHLGDYMQKIVQEMVIKNSKKIEKKKTLS